MRLPLLFLFIICIPRLHSQSKEHKMLIHKTILKYKSYKSISYELDYMIKSFNSDEPHFINSKVYIIKDTEDTIFKSKFIYNIRDGKLDVSKYYSLPYVYVIDSNEEKVFLFDASKGQISPITGSIDGDVLKIYFPDIEQLQRKLISAENVMSYQDTANFLRITIKYPDDENLYDEEECVYIDKITQTITKITYQVKYKNQILFKCWMLRNIEFDDLKFSDIENRIQSYLNSFKIVDYNPFKEDDYNLLDSGAIAPKLYGKLFPDYKNEIELKINKITILDFWYTSCLPCIKMIPILNKLIEKFGYKIEIIGINPIENKAKDKEKIEIFIKQNSLKYPILLVDTLPAEFNVRAYPTLYILDQNRQVKFSKIGFSENAYEELEKVLTELINNK